MNHPVDMHPEDLLDREIEGELTPEERSRLDAHTAWCGPCALVRQASGDFANERQAVQGDAALIHRISAAALGSTAPFAAPMPAHRSSFVLSHPRRRRRAWAVAGVVLFAATGATASFWSVRHGFVSRLLVQTPITAPAPRPEPKEPTPARAVTAPRIEPAAPVIESTPAAPPAAKVASPNARLRATEDIAPVSADVLFASANEARRRGDSVQAVKLYRQLQQQFPGTREETTSRVLLGRLLLDRGEDPAQSLALFARYLTESPNGTLAEEARLGRALALTRLGRTQEERQAWQELLSSHPKSIHAERARKRLDELR